MNLQVVLMCKSHRESVIYIFSVPVVLSKVRNMGTEYGPVGLLGTLKGTHRVDSRYIRLPDLRASTRGAWFEPLILRF